MTVDINAVAIQTSQILNSYNSLLMTYYNMFYNTTPMDIELQIYDTNSNLKTYTVPNRAKDLAHLLNGSGAPETIVSATMGSTYQDIVNGDLYIKTTSTGNTGWNLIISKRIFDNYIIKGSGSPEGITFAINGVLYLDDSRGDLYIKTTSTGNTGWAKYISEKGGTFTGNISVPNGTERSHAINLGQLLDILNGSLENIKLTLDTANMPSTSYNKVNPNTDIDISTGFCSDIKLSKTLQLITPLTKKLSQPFAAGTNAGGFISVGTHIAKENSAQYNIFLISNGSQTDACMLHYTECVTSDAYYLELATAGSYEINIPTSGIYSVELVGGGGAGYHTDGGVDQYGNTGWAYHYYHTGASGAFFKGDLNLIAGTYKVNVGAGGTNGEPGGNTTIDNIITIGGGGGAHVAGGSWVVPIGGTVGTSTSINATVLSLPGNNGNDYGGYHDGAWCTFSGTNSIYTNDLTGYGAGGGTNGGYSVAGLGGYLKITSIGTITSNADILSDEGLTAVAEATQWDKNKITYRRLASIKTDLSGNIIRYLQKGDLFIWEQAIADIISKTSSGVRTLFVTTSPIGTQCQIQIVSQLQSSGGLKITCPDVPDYTNAQYDVTWATSVVPGTKHVLTNRAAQIGLRCTTAAPINLWTLDYTDPRGKQ